MPDPVSFEKIPETAFKVRFLALFDAGHWPR